MNEINIEKLAIKYGVLKVAKSINKTVIGNINELSLKQLCEAYYAEKQREQSEPFGYFKAEPFGWTDCAETDEGAIALYEAPTVQREGWVSVPIEPTEEMIENAKWEDGKLTAINVYKLMLEAAPKE